MIQWSRALSETLWSGEGIAKVYVCDSWRGHRVYAPRVPYEDEVARRWWSLPLNSFLPLLDGGRYQLRFPGRPGGSAGPDVRDAIFSVPGHSGALPDSNVQDLSPAGKLVGDVEFHVRSSDWRGHRHDTDPRYNAVVLHVVLICDDPYPTLRQDKTPIPTCSLYDLVALPPTSLHTSHQESPWPCQRLTQNMPADEVAKLLLSAGLLRFEQKAHAFIEQLHATTSEDASDAYNAYDSYDACLIPALAEGLGYGRDREFFRAIGFRLLQKHAALPEPLGHTLQPAPLDAKRLYILAQLLKRWRIPGVWRTLRACLLPADDSATNVMILAALRQAFVESGLSVARTDILLCNVVLPFAAAVALLEKHVQLAERAQQLYIQHPGLSSNRITRMMCAQLQLAAEPWGGCQQQGLHYIYQQTCREKLCSICVMGKYDI